MPDKMPQEYGIRPFLPTNRVEVSWKMKCLTEYNEAETMQMFKEEGRKEGREEGRLEIVLNLVREGILTVKEGAGQLGMAETELEARMKQV